MPFLRGDLDRDRSPDDLLYFFTMGSLKALSLPAFQDESKSDLLHVSGGHETSGDYMEGLEAASQPPTPPERPGTPRVTIAPCPVRLTPLIPPENFGAVEPFTIYRSGFPSEYNVDFLEALKTRSLLTLVEHTPTGTNGEVTRFLETFGVTHAKISIQKNKGSLRTTTDSLCEALLFILNPMNHPVHIHCNMGKHRTGCVVACLRKCQKWPIDEVLAEYVTYASDKARETDMEVIKAFDPACVYEYAKRHKRLELWPKESRQDSAADVWQLAAYLPVHDVSQIPRDDESEDNADEWNSDDDDEVLTMKHSPVHSMKVSKDRSAHTTRTAVPEADMEDDMQIAEDKATNGIDVDREGGRMARYRGPDALAPVLTSGQARVY